MTTFTEPVISLAHPYSKAFFQASAAESGQSYLTATVVSPRGASAVGASVMADTIAGSFAVADGGAAGVSSACLSGCACNAPGGFSSASAHAATVVQPGV